MKRERIADTLEWIVVGREDMVERWEGNGVSRERPAVGRDTVALTRS